MAVDSFLLLPPLKVLAGLLAHLASSSFLSAHLTTWVVKEGGSHTHKEQPNSSHGGTAEGPPRPASAASQTSRGAPAEGLALSPFCLVGVSSTESTRKQQRLPSPFQENAGDGGVPVLLPLPHPLLILPRDATQPCVQLKVLLCRQLVEKGVELRTVAQALLDLQKLLQDAVETESWAEHKARGSSLPRRPPEPLQKGRLGGKGVQQPRSKDNVQ